MKASDEKLVHEHPAEYRKALAAAAIALRSDRRFLGAPKMRERLEEICALHALGSEKASIGKSTIESMSIDNRNLYVDGLGIGTAAAKAALESVAA
jgi:hypothetical protein